MQSSDPTTTSPVPSVGVVVLTSGGRAVELAAMAESLADQPLHERILVANGVAADAPAGWSVISSPTNLGVPGGRTLGMRHATSDVLIFLDDDSAARSSDLVQRTQAVFAADPRLGAVAYRVVATGTNEALRRWTPAHTTSGSSELCDAVTFPGNGHALRRVAVDDVGGYTHELFFKHEETELSWKLLDAGWNVQYVPGLMVEHPATSEGRNPDALRLGARNKVWLARGLLPRPLDWIAIAIS